jgi:hypothetical protein
MPLAGIAFAVCVFNIEAVAVFPTMQRVDMHLISLHSNLHFIIIKGFV